MQGIAVIFRIILMLLLHRKFKFWSDWLWVIITGAATGYIAKMFAGMKARDDDITSMGGISGYIYDFFFIALFSQATAWITPYFWLTYMVIPGYGLFLLAKKLLQQSNEQERELTDDEQRIQSDLKRKEDRRQQRREKRQNKGIKIRQK
ncbi:MAG: hypothetical protein EZS28_002437 [Streblomastix strix]|uniref:Uncharacterized protein n=1 Tax=Streblomastix strix TaxID=222440 RepID=A0A5J4X5E3_9EUKA|nr:MAG: hypothetical protein EZS28_002431 [Streblomastix strix]KAA6402042.1 MAG: hypothetical protein EZS28_002437 [Streblomastix strix]